MSVNVGIDVSKKSLDICLLHDQTKSGQKYRKFQNKKEIQPEISAWLLKFSRCKAQDILITMESTGVYHESIALYLHLAGFKVFISNPGKAKKFSQSLGLTHKTDKTDSYMLALYGDAQGNRAHHWVPDDLNTRNIKSLSRRLSALEKDRLRESNRLEASEISGAHERVIGSIKRIISIINEEIASIEQEIDLTISSDPIMKKNHQLLQSVVGVGKVISRELVYLFSAKQFSSAKQAAAFVGLIPRLNESGNFKGRTTLSKVGPSRVRAKLFLAAVSASTHNPDIKEQKRRLLEAGKTKMQALGAAMRKLVQICYGVLKTQTEYR
ncbi:putative transposase, partial [Vibrio halioticoli NBRC 102217]